MGPIFLYFHLFGSILGLIAGFGLAIGPLFALISKSSPPVAPPSPLVRVFVSRPIIALSSPIHHPPPHAPPLFDRLI